MAWCGQRTMYTPKHACETRKGWQNSGERARQRRSGWTGTYNAEGGLAHTGRRPTSPPSHLAIAAGVVHDEPLVLRQQAVLQQQWVIPLHGRSGHATGHPSPTSAGHKGAKGRGCACKHVFRFFLVCFIFASPCPFSCLSHMLPALASARGGGGGSAAGGSSLLPLYIRRIIHAPQMDLEFALYQMLWLCKSPKAVYVMWLLRFCSRPLQNMRGGRKMTQMR